MSHLRVKSFQRPPCGWVTFHRSQQDQALLRPSTARPMRDHCKENCNSQRQRFHQPEPHAWTASGDIEYQLAFEPTDGQYCSQWGCVAANQDWGHYFMMEGIIWSTQPSCYVFLCEAETWSSWPKLESPKWSKSFMVARLWVLMRSTLSISGLWYCWAVSSNAPTILVSLDWQIGAVVSLYKKVPERG